MIENRKAKKIKKIWAKVFRKRTHPLSKMLLYRKTISDPSIITKESKANGIFTIKILHLVKIEYQVSVSELHVVLKFRKASFRLMRQKCTFFRSNYLPL